MTDNLRRNHFGVKPLTLYIFVFNKIRDGDKGEDVAED